MTNNRIIGKIKAEINKAEHIVLVSHIRPDGDALGSLLGFGLSLRKYNKHVQMVLEDGVPINFKYLPHAIDIKIKPQGSFDYTIVLDSAELNRTGENIFIERKPDLNIDHHITNTFFAKTNLVDTKASATAEILTALLHDLGLPIDQQIAYCLLTGIITDTIGFRTENTTPKTLRFAADLCEFGVNLNSVYKNALLTKSFEALKYWGAGLTKIRTDGRLIWSTLTIEDRKLSKYGGNDDADLINILSSVNDKDIAIIFIEQTNQEVKVSWRAKQGFDVSKIALEFGGGGHKPAAGANIQGNLDDVIENVLNITKSYLNAN
ncbi:MAG: bifunctional oligoribonuclease/PAP phosphatase NrnA [Anaerolineales bacterium]|nr:bifunctional oligoribonuclease/PAP phosphatase NrnA [Anaerolineales bacterium]